jgi:hypothetical protein
MIGIHQFAKYVACEYPETAAELKVSFELLARAAVDTLYAGAVETKGRKAAKASVKEGKNLENILDDEITELII